MTHLGRRAKYLVARLSSGEVLMMHLGMSGRFSISLDHAPATAATRGNSSGRVLADFTYDTGSDPAHDHAVFHMTGHATVTYNDPRRFGYMQLIAEAEIEQHPLFASLGVEPLGNELTAGYLAQRARGRSAELKAFLMDQRNIAGLGNIYVCEALFRAALAPGRSSAALADRNGRPTVRTERLIPAIRSVLEEAIEAGGSTLRDYKHTDGSLGYFQHRFRVYGREGKPCVGENCGGTVSRMVQSGRSTFYCARCQK